MSDAPTRRPSGPLRRAGPWLLAGLLLATMGVPSAGAALSFARLAPEVGYAHPLASPPTVVVNLTDQPAYSPKYLSVPVGSSVAINLHNTGNYVHTFTLCATPNALLAPSATPAEVYRFFQTNGSLANVSLAPGAQGWANLTFNASVGVASFEFASVVPYQFQAGMFGFLNTTSVGPGLVLSENTTDALSFVPNELSASPARYPVTLDVLITNQGTFGHTFTVAPQSNVTLLSTNFTTYFTQHRPLASSAVPSGAGLSVWANFTVVGPGVYEYLCEVPGHFASGMYGFLYVGVPVPVPPAPPSTAVVDTWVLIGSAILLGIGGVLAVVASLAGRFRRSPGSRSGHH